MSAYVSRPAGSGGGRVPRRALEEFHENQLDYEDARNSGRVRYDDNLIGRGTDFLDVDNPVEYDPDYRKNVFSEMSQALRANLEQTRKSPSQTERVYVERSRPSSTSAPQQARPEPRPHSRQQPQADWQEYDPYDEEEEYTPSPRRREPDYPVDAYEALEPVSEGYDPDPIPTRRRQQPRRTSNYPQSPVRQVSPRSGPEYRQQRPVPSRERAQAARGYPPGQRPVRPAPVRPTFTPDRREDGYTQRPTFTPDRREDGYTQRPARQGPTPEQRRPASYPERLPQQRRASPDHAAPSRPEFLGPDGRTATNPCGQPLYVHLFGPEAGPLAVECQEERRGDAPPWHHNMPHIARINDPRMNAANACLVWYYEDERPGQ